MNSLCLGYPRNFKQLKLNTLTLYKYIHRDIKTYTHTNTQIPIHRHIIHKHKYLLSHISSWPFQTYSDRRNHCRVPSQLWPPLLADLLTPYLSPPVAMGYTLQSSQLKSTNFSKVSVGISSIVVNKTNQLYFIHYYRVTIKINLLNS